ncbi:hypothetical protein [Streptomyces sp. SudanB135_2055]
MLVEGSADAITTCGDAEGIDVEVVQRPRVKGFQPLPKRWVIE